jgi:hypothetical protein
MGVYMSNQNEQIDAVLETVSWKNKDIFFLFYLIVLITTIIMIIQFVTYLYGISIQFTLENFARTLNIGIILIGTSEGVRSFTKSSSQKIGESSPVPAYKLRYLLSYIISFFILTTVAIVFHIYVNGIDVFDRTTNELLPKPNFAYDDMTHGLLSNFVCYLIARYGDKLAENIDFSDLSFFKKK